MKALDFILKTMKNGLVIFSVILFVLLGIFIFYKIALLSQADYCEFYIGKTKISIDMLQYIDKNNLNPGDILSFIFGVPSALVASFVAIYLAHIALAITKRQENMDYYNFAEPRIEKCKKNISEISMAITNIYENSRLLMAQSKIGFINTKEHQRHDDDDLYNPIKNSEDKTKEIIKTLINRLIDSFENIIENIVEANSNSLMKVAWERKRYDIINKVKVNKLNDTMSTNNHNIVEICTPNVVRQLMADSIYKLKNIDTDDISYFSRVGKEIPKEFNALSPFLFLSALVNNRHVFQGENMQYEGTVDDYASDYECEVTLLSVAVIYNTLPSLCDIKEEFDELYFGQKNIASRGSSFTKNILTIDESKIFSDEVNESFSILSNDYSVCDDNDYIDAFYKTSKRKNVRDCYN